MENKFPIFEETKLEKKQQKEVAWIYVMSVLIFFAILSFVIFRFWVYYNFTYYPISGISMEPGINNGAPPGTVRDGVLVQKNAAFTYGDIVIVQPDNTEGTWIKRVIAKEGDKISIKQEEDGYYHVSIKYKNSNEIQVLQEDYINGYAEWTNSIVPVMSNNIIYEGNFYNYYINRGQNITLESDGALYYEVPEKHLFFMGDNRQVSMDARIVGTFRYDQVVAVARAILPNAGLIKDNKHLWAVQVQGYIDYFWRVICDFFA